MSKETDIAAALPASCHVVVPKPGDNISTTIPRWSLGNTQLPYAVVTPTTTQDIVSIVHFARTHHLKVVPSAGGHASFVPITSKTIYLRLSNFKTIQLNQEEAEVRVGGGVTNGEVLRSLAAKGWMTVGANSNALGMVGSLLGGLSHALAGLKGTGVDCIKAITVVPFSMPDGSEVREVVLEKHAGDEAERALFWALCGAGHGLGVVTSVVLEAWRTVDLGLQDNQLWSRTLMFPPHALPVATTLYLTMSTPPQPAELSTALVFLRSPPTSPHPGAPLALLSLKYFGPTAAAGAATAASSMPEVTSHAIMASTKFVNIGEMNTPFEGLDRHGGYKDMHGAFMTGVDAASIQKAFDSWIEYTSQDLPTRGSSYVLFSSFSNDATQTRAQETEPSMLRLYRDRCLFVQAVPWYGTEAEGEEAHSFSEAVLDAARERDRRGGVEDRGFGNNLKVGQDLGSVYAEGEMRRIREVKAIWDFDGVGWSPVVDGW